MNITTKETNPRGRKGDGSVFYLEKKDIWVARYKPPNTKRPIEKTAHSKAKANSLLRQMKVDYKNKTPVEIKKQSSEAYINNWFNTVAINNFKSPKSYDTKEYTLLNNVYPHIGSIQINSLTSRDVQTMVNDLGKTKGQRTGEYLSYSTIKKAFDVVNACFKYAVAEGDIEKNPCATVTIPKLNEKEVSDIRFFNDDEIKTICDTAVLKHKNGKQIYRLGWAVIFLIYTGIRDTRLTGSVSSDL